MRAGLYNVGKDLWILAIEGWKDGTKSFVKLIICSARYNSNKISAIENWTLKLASLLMTKLWTKRVATLFLLKFFSSPSNDGFPK